jgi:hypothetical protein
VTAGLLCWPEPELGTACFERIHVGMPYEEAKNILHESGCEVTGGDAIHKQVSFKFTRTDRRGDPRSGQRTDRVSDRTWRYSRRRPRCRFVEIRYRSARPPLLSVAFGALREMP